MIAPTQSNATHLQKFDLKPVFGQGREKRWQEVQNIIQSKIEPLFGSQKQLVEDLPKSEAIKCRLLVNGEQPVGVLVYHTELTRDYEKKGFSNCLKLRIFYAQDLEKEGYKPQSSYLLNEAISYAKGLGADGICLKTAQKAAHLLQFLKANDFQAVDDSNRDFPIYARLVNQNKAQSKGKREYGNEETQTAKRQKEEPKAAEASSPRYRQAPSATPSRLVECPIMLKYFQMIENGSKTIEGRINTGMFQKLQVGQEIRFKNGASFVVCTITAIHKYQSFEEMLKKEGVKPCLPDTRTLEEGVDIYNKIPGYSEKAARYGVLAIHIKRQAT